MRLLMCFLFQYDSSGEVEGYKTWQMPTICKFQKKQKALFYYLIDLASTWVQISGMCSNIHAQHFQKKNKNGFLKWKVHFRHTETKTAVLFGGVGVLDRASEKTMFANFISYSNYLKTISSKILFKKFMQF